jgi:hypothetical protein
MTDSRVVQSRTEVRIFIETSGRLDLGNVGRFMQRLDTVARRAAAGGASNPRIEIVSLASGSVEIRIAVASLLVAVGSLAFDAGGFAMNIAQALTSEPAAARSCKALLEGDNGTVILIEGGGQASRLTSGDFDAANEYEVARKLPRGAPRDDVVREEVLTGPQKGTIRQFGGENWVELDGRPGLIIRLRDERSPPTDFLEENRTYVLDGDAHLAPAGRPSFFLLRSAILLG